MPTIIDSLVVELGFDTNGLEAGRKKVEDTFKRTGQAGAKAGKEIENSAKNAEQFLNKLRNNVLALFAVFTAGRGLKDFVAGMTTTDATLGRFAKTVNMSAKDLASWRAAGSLMGVSAQDIDGTISGLTQQFQQFALTGDSTVVPYFRSLGIAMSDAGGHMRPMDQLLMDLSKHLQGMDPARAVAIMNGMGIAPGMQQMILQGPAAMQKMLDSQKALAEAQARDAPAAAARQAAWNDFLNQATAVGTVILETLTPALIGLTNVIKGIAEFFQAHPELAGIAFAALTGVVLALTAALGVLATGAALSTIATGFGALVGLAGDLSLGLAILSETALPALSEAFLGLGIAIEATPIGWIITGIAAISVAGYELYKHWDAIAKWWSELWGGMGNDADDGADKITGAADKIKGGKSDGAAGAGSPRGAGGALPKYNTKGGPSQEDDVKALMSMGWTREQATGIVANITEESGGRADATGDNGTAFGLAQWHADRQANFKAWAGKDIRQATRAEQLAFINYELRSGTEKKAGAILAQTQTAEHAARAFNTYDERPADIAGNNATRAAIATAMLRASPGVVPSTANLAANAAGSQGGNYNHQTSETRIGEVKVYTQATDAAGIARDLKPAMARDTFAQQAQQGPA